MAELQISNYNIDALFDAINEALSKEPLVLVAIQSMNTGKWTMSRLWRKWMSITAEFMAANGVTMPLMLKADGSAYGKRAFSCDDAHELFTSQWLGLDADGTRLSWSKKGHDGMRPATKGERFNALRKHENWCVDKGVRLFVPRNSEYEQLQREQNQ